MTWEEYGKAMSGHAHYAFAHMGRWMARTWSLMIAWFSTYLVMFAMMIWPDVEWLIALAALPILLHAFLEPILIKRYAKEFGEAKFEYL